MGGESQESEGLNEIHASEILAKIGKGKPITYDHVIIKGNLDISRLNLPKEGEKYIISSPIKIIDSKIEGNLIFSETIFKETVYFRGAQFIKNANFGGSRFIKDADFGNSQFRREASFSGSQFEGEAAFSRSLFSQNVSFSKSQFNKDVFFRKSKFSEDSNFNGSHFKGEANFRESQFCKKAKYRKSQFYQDVDFSRSKFNGSIIDFELAHFMADAFFDDVEITERLSLSRTKYEKLYIRWKNVTKPKYRWNILENWRWVALTYEKNHGEATYLSLIENFKKLGFFEDADNCYYYYRNERRRDLPKPYRPADWILMVLYGYGVRPIRLLIWALIFFSAFGLLYATQGGAFGFARIVSPIDALNVSYTLLLSGTKLIDDPNHAATGTLYFIFTFEKLLGSLFFALFLVSVGRTIVR
jgi:uncharacterized protein YjbI with pentapeptide repeats